MSNEQLTGSREQLPDIRLSEMPELKDHSLYGREYELLEAVTIAGKSVVISGDVINHGDGASLGIDPRGLIMETVRAQFDDPNLTPNDVYKWTVTVEPHDTKPLEDGLFPTSYMTHNLNRGDDEAAQAVAGWAVGVYRQDIEKERAEG